MSDKQIPAKDVAEILCTQVPKEGIEERMNDALDKLLSCEEKLRKYFEQHDGGRG